MAYDGPYGSEEGVQAYVRHMRFNGTNAPTAADIERWLTERAAQLTSWLMAAGYTVPVTADHSAEAKAVLDRYANLGAAGEAELAQRNAGGDAEDTNRRENKFLAEFARAEAWITGDVLAAMGIARTVPDPSPAPSSGTAKVWVVW